MTGNTPSAGRPAGGTPPSKAGGAAPCRPRPVDIPFKISSVPERCRRASRSLSVWSHLVAIPFYPCPSRRISRLATQYVHLVIVVPPRLEVGSGECHHIHPGIQLGEFVHQPVWVARLVREERFERDASDQRLDLLGPCAWPGSGAKSTNLPVASVGTTVLVVNPTRDRPMTCGPRSFPVPAAFRRARRTVPSAITRRRRFSHATS